MNMMWLCLFISQSTPVPTSLPPDRSRWPPQLPNLVTYSDAGRSRFPCGLSALGRFQRELLAPGHFHLGLLVSSGRRLSPSSGPQLPPACCCSRPYFGPATSAVWASRTPHISTPLVIFDGVKVTLNTKTLVLYHIILMYIPNMLDTNTYKLLLVFLVLISLNGI